MICENSRRHYGPMVIFVCLHFTLLHYHHCADVYEGFEFLQHLSGIFSRRCLSLNQFSQLSSMHFVRVVFSLFISPMLIVRICVLYVKKSNRKYDPFPIVNGSVMKKMYALYVFLYYHVSVYMIAIMCTNFMIPPPPPPPIFRNILTVVTVVTLQPLKLNYLQ